MHGLLEYCWFSFRWKYFIIVWVEHTHWKTKGQSKKWRSALPSLLRHPTSQSIILSGHVFTTRGCILMGTASSLLRSFFSCNRNNKPNWQSSGFHCNLNFAVGNWLTSSLAPCQPPAAVDFHADCPQGWHGAQSAQAPKTVLLHFPVLTGCLVISSGNIGQILLLGSAHCFHTPEFNSPFLHSSNHRTEFSLDESLESNVSHNPNRLAFISLWETVTSACYKMSSPEI